MTPAPQQATARLLRTGFGRQLSHCLEGFRSSACGLSTARAFSLLGTTNDRSQLSKSGPAKRHFSFTPIVSKEFFPAPNSPQIRETKPAWPHPIYSEEQMTSVAVAHREAKTWPDYVALGAVKFLRWGLDFVTGYKHDKEVAKSQITGQKPFAMNERKYMIRNVFLESVAGVPGMVGGMLRHLGSMRRMKRDNGW